MDNQHLRRLIMSYKLSELIRGSNPSMEYFIPGEIVDKDIIGKINRVPAGIGGWVSARKLSWYLSKINWTPQQWYNVFIINIGRYESAKCLQCGADLRWTGKVSWGYYQYCLSKCSQRALGDSESFRKSRSDYMYNRWRDPKYVDLMHDPSKNMIRFAGMSKGSQLRNAINNPIGVFYITHNPSELKIGCYLTDTDRTNSTILGDSIKYIGNSYDVIECEYQFKIDHASDLLYPDRIGHTGYTEIFHPSLLNDAKEYALKFNLTLSD